MQYQLPWGNLPDRYRVGESFDETIILYRGDKIARISPDLGILSTAVATGNTNMMYEFGDACAARDEVSMSTMINSHGAVYVHRDWSPTPFVSATARRTFAEMFAQGDDEAVVEFEVPVNRVVAHPTSSHAGLQPYEILVIGGIAPEDIRAVHLKDHTNQ